MYRGRGRNLTLTNSARGRGRSMQAPRSLKYVRTPSQVEASSVASREAKSSTTAGDAEDAQAQNGLNPSMDAAASNPDVEPNAQPMASQNGQPIASGS